MILQIGRAELSCSMLLSIESHSYLCQQAPADRSGLAARQLLHEIAEVLVHRPCLWFVGLRDGLEHHGHCGHVLPRVEEVLGAIALLGELVLNFPCREFIDFPMSLLYDVVDPVKPSHEGIELLLLLAERFLASEHPGLALALILLLDGASSFPPPFSPHSGVAKKQALLVTSMALVSSTLLSHGLNRPQGC